MVKHIKESTDKDVEKTRRIMCLQIKHIIAQIEIIENNQKDILEQ